MLKILNIVLEKKSCLSDDFSAKIDKTRNNWLQEHATYATDTDVFKFG